MSKHTFVTLESADGAQAVIAPELGGWLLQYRRHIPELGLVDALHCTQEIIDRYPKEMYAGNPVLFPLVSKSRVAGKDHVYEWEGRQYDLPQHGFGRRQPWKVIAQGPENVTMELTDNDATRAAYPFAFRHCITYRLVEGRLHWEQVIENRSEVPMPFASGFHPYFLLPLGPGGTRNGCYIDIPESVQHQPVGEFQSFTSEPYAARHLSVAEDVSGTLFLGNLATPELALVDPGAGLEVRLNWASAPKHRFVAIWSKSTTEPFYCLEPWTALPNAFSRPDDRELLMLEPNQTFQAAFWMEIRKTS
ncbi:MAG TPA: hypothetical protein VK968_04370 [Roseimicrobium sp.]|nr:hypothetical protein [Roseimicrobium sp.]